MVIRATASSLVVLPRGYLHGFWNDTDSPARLLLIMQAAASRGVEVHFDKVPASAVHLLPK
jgi:oxalate decarboxylase/phosphoglucose isomerase-like protein (cupin superfamily)